MDMKKTCDDLAANGKLIEAGWIALRAASISADAPQNQLDEMRSSFFAGAKHLLDCITTIMDPGDEPTEADLKRMDLIAAELDTFLQEYSMKFIKTEGSA